MPGKRVVFDINDAIRMYEAGESSIEIAKTLGCHAVTIIRKLREAGVAIRKPWESARLFYQAQTDLSDAVRLYAEGEDLKSLCAQFGIGPHRMESALVLAGVHRRTSGQSLRIRYSRMSEAERAVITRQANIAKRGRPASQKALELRAKTYESTLQAASRADLILGMWLNQRGIQLTPQKAIGPYNVDIAIHEPAVAVEVNGYWHYLSHRISSDDKRREYILDSGWMMIEVRLDSFTASPWKHLRPTCADKIVSLLDSVRVNVATRGKHWVIGGDGESLS
jgi:very-short-patch-repair endonuclease